MPHDREKPPGRPRGAAAQAREVVRRAHLTDLQKLGGGLIKAVADKDGAGAMRLLADAADEVERMRQDSRHSDGQAFELKEVRN